MNIVIVGFGKMGQLVKKTCEEHGHTILMVCDITNCHDLDALQDNVDVVIDFSHPDNLAWLLPYVKKTGAALVCGTTGINDLQRKQIEELGESNRVIYSANYSFGIAVFKEVLSMITPMLSADFDIEVIEKHHNQKQDAPSGTAKLLVETMNPDHDFKEVHGRNGMVGKRQKEIGIHAVRGGTLAGEHSVYFLGDDESFEITHTATSRQIFVNGAVRAAEFLVKQPNGSYTMKDLLFHN
ncbi:4-hydroxy-tetrahydrodipicolinate reductase [[Eubacterium] hominis]|uniref:4-hydroxy-tetrahydrodipicolinate reductase n=1 Tax=[Eubacterium] hominis TaxID=2764325 RepID=UPI003A4E0C7C